MAWPRVDPIHAVDAQLRDLVQRRLECRDPDCAEMLALLSRADILLDRRNRLMLSKADT